MTNLSPKLVRIIESHLVFGHPVPIQEEKFQTDVLQANVSVAVQVGQLKDEGLVKDRVQGSLLDVSLFLCNPLVVVQQIDLDVRVCKI